MRQIPSSKFLVAARLALFRAGRHATQRSWIAYALL
jgi:hypothetical protein